VKGFVLLAIILLTPAMAYFNILHFKRVMQPALRAEVEEVLRAGGVEEPAVRMDYLDAIIRGKVESEEDRRRIAGRVERLPGVRLLPSGNRLAPLGWLRIARRGGVITAEGILPEEIALGIPASLDVKEGWDAGVMRRAGVRVPPGLTGWNGLLEGFFDVPGERSIELRRGGLEMEGSATVGLRADWRAEASGVVGKKRVSERFALYPSRYHFPAYEPVTVAGSGRRARLCAVLEEARIVFDAGSAEVPASEVKKVSKVANAILTAAPEARFVVGGHPGGGGTSGNVALARQRAEVVGGMLREYGVSEARVELTAFGAVPGSGWDNRVEILFK